MTGGVQGQIHRVPVAELLELFRIVATNPACRGDADLLEAGFDAVLVLESIGHHVELQRTHRPQNQVVAHQGAEELGRTLFRQLRQTFLQLLQLERITQGGIKL